MEEMSSFFIPTSSGEHNCFKRAWSDKNYRLIVTVAERLPNSVLQEDPGLLMYYDNALMRVEKEPVQGRLL